MKFFTRFCAAFILAPALHAGDAAVADPDLPQPFDPNAAAELLMNSPFTRTVSLEDTLQLTGMAYVEGRPVATFLNKATGRSIVVSEEPNALGMRLTGTTPGTDLRDTQVQLMVGTEMITAHYGDAQLSPGAGKKGVPTARLASSDGRMKNPSPSRDDKKFKTSTMLGEHGKELYSSLSATARDKLKDLVKNYSEKHPELSQEQTSAYAQKVYTKIKAADQSSAPAKTEKTSRKKEKD